VVVEGRTERKRAAITEAATTLFLRAGFRGTSMDEIAAAAAVSKQTVYKQFGDKETLFTEIVRTLVSAASDPVHDTVRALETTGDLQADLRALARRQLELVLQPSLMQLRRLVIAEAPRFPELGRLFHELGPARTIDALADALATLAAGGRLRLGDAHVAAAQLNWLVMGEPLNRAMLLGFDAPPPSAEIERWATTGVDAFLAAYGAER
jgi:TetR/AcrR family transcriptional regulator, mexJK operon transcriptional repressor